MLLGTLRSDLMSESKGAVLKTESAGICMACGRQELGSMGVILECGALGLVQL